MLLKNILCNLVGKYHDHMFILFSVHESSLINYSFKHFWGFYSQGDSKVLIQSTVKSVSLKKKKNSEHIQTKHSHTYTSLINTSIVLHAFINIP